MTTIPFLKKKPLTTYLEHHQWQRLTALSRRTHVAMNWYLRAGVDLVLDEFDPPAATPPAADRSPPATE